MTSTQVIVINGGSSSGKSGITRCLKAILLDPWLSLGVDDLLDALPPPMHARGKGVEFGEAGEVTLGDGFRQMEIAWTTGIAAIAVGRELARGDRVVGMALSQAQSVHEGVTYDVEVDTGHPEALDCARVIAAHVR